MNLDTRSIFEGMSAEDLRYLVTDPDVAAAHRIQAFQVLVSLDKSAFEADSLFGPSLRSVLLELVREIASGFDGDERENMSKIVGMLTHEFFRLRDDYFDERTNPWPCEHQPAMVPFPFPVVEMPKSSDGEFETGPFYQFSALKMFGYTVGKRGWVTSERHRFLRAFMESELPRVVQEVFGNDYGDPMTAVRLKKVANVIAASANLALRRNARQNAAAIRDWSDDLGFLRREYYEKHNLRFVPWPDTGKLREIRN